MTRFFAFVFIIVSVLGFAGGSIWALDYFEIIEVSHTAQKVPVVGKYFADEVEQEPEDPLVAENKKLSAEIVSLKKTVGELEQQVEVLKTEKEGFEKENDNLEKDLDALKLNIQEAETGEKNYQQLAKYYAEMKPAAAVKIMDNLADEVVIGILQYLEEGQAAKILSTMDPKRASELVDLMRE